MYGDCIDGLYSLTMNQVKINEINVYTSPYNNVMYGLYQFLCVLFNVGPYDSMVHYRVDYLNL